MKDNFKRLILGFAIITQFLVYQNCSKVGVADLTDEKAQAAAPNQPAADCTQGLEYVTKPVKVLLVVDTSGSNVKDEWGPGTDIGKVWRSKVINSIVDRYGKNPAISFGIITFQDTYITPQIKSGSGEAIFTNNLSVVRAGIQNFMDTPDQNGTPTDKALQFAADMIKKDRAANPGENAGYSVVVLSDGVPHKETYNNDPDQVKPDAQLVMDADPGMVRLNSVFYYVPETYDGLPIQLMKNIASVGQGTFLEANTGQDFVIDNLVQYAKAVCQ